MRSMVMERRKRRRRRVRRDLILAVVDSIVNFFAFIGVIQENGWGSGIIINSVGIHTIIY